MNRFVWSMALGVSGCHLNSSLPDEVGDSRPLDARADSRADARGDASADASADARDGVQICLDGSSGAGTSIALSAFDTLSAATVEFWYRSADAATPAAAHAQLIYFHPAAYVGGNYPSLGLEIADASALAMAPLTGRVVAVGVDARGGPQNELNARGFAVATTAPGFDEKSRHHYAAVFDGSVQRLFVDGSEITSTHQRDGSEATSFDSAFGAGFTGTYGPLYMSIGYFARDGIRFARGGFSDVRVSSIARYTTNFTPVFPATKDANTILLLPITEDTGSTSLDQGGSAYDVSWTGGFSWAKLSVACP